VEKSEKFRVWGIDVVGLIIAILALLTFIVMFGNVLLISTGYLYGDIKIEKVKTSCYDRYSSKIEGLVCYESILCSDMDIYNWVVSKCKHGK